MRFVRTWFGLFRKDALDRELSDEMRFHLEKLNEQNVAAGMNPVEARRAALLVFGGVEQIKEECRDTWGIRFIDVLTRDARLALRMLVKSPGFTLMATLTLALGLGAVTTIFALVETVLLRPLDYPHPDQIVSVSQEMPSVASGHLVVALNEFRRLQATGLFEHTAVMQTEGYTLIGSGHPQRIEGMSVTPDFFRVFGVQPFLGRDFKASDATTASHRVMVLSYPLWRDAFGGESRVVGKTITMLDGSMTIIGVMPPSFDFPRLVDVRTIMPWAPEQTEFWTPLVIDGTSVDQEDGFNCYMLGRLIRGVNPSRASGQFRASAIKMFRDNEIKYPSRQNLSEQIINSLVVSVVPLKDSMAWGIRGSLWMLLAAVGLLLGLVLFNLSNLLLIRNTERQHEIALREAFGATRWQLFRQTFVEQIFLVSGAAVLGLLVSEWAVSVIRNVGAARIPRLYALSLDARVSVLLVALSLVIAVAFGALSLMVLRNTRPSSAVQGLGRRLTANRRTNRLNYGLTVLQITVSMILLIVAGLLIESFKNVMRVDPGFDYHNVLNLTVGLDLRKNQDPGKRLAHFRQMLESFRSIPGVESASVVTSVPLIGNQELEGVTPTGGPLSGRSMTAEYRTVDASYFRTMRIPFFAGREFRENEPVSSVIINHKMAARLWPGEDAVGKEFTDGGDDRVTVIGVVGDVLNVSLETAAPMQVYMPLETGVWFSEFFMIRTRLEPLAILPSLKRTLWRYDPDGGSISHPQTMERLFQSVTLDRRFETGLVTGFAAAALFLAAVGLFSVASLSVSRRTTELGIRRALGATGRELVQREMGRALAVVVVGLSVGVVGALAAAKSLAGLLYGVTPWNVRVYFAAIVVLIVPALIAVWIPARRAAKVDPMVALRYE